MLARVVRAVLGVVPARRRGVGGARVVNLIARGIWTVALTRLPTGTTMRCRLASGTQAELDLSERIQGQAALTGAYEPSVCDEIARALPPGGTFFDVGGNVGLVTLEVLGRKDGAEPSVHVFEPHPRNVAALERSLSLNGAENVRVQAAAVGAAAGSAHLKTSDNPNESGCHRIVEAAELRDDVITVPVVALDDYARSHGIDRVDVLKVDVEGHEAAVLEGARELLGRRAIGMVILEVNESLIGELGREADDLYATLSANGYEPTVIPSTSPSRLLRRLHHMAADDVAFRPTG
jgi:FkbM family methyltransferase